MDLAADRHHARPRARGPRYNDFRELFHKSLRLVRGADGRPETAEELRRVYGDVDAST